ncbi:MAG: amino acid ABC transporter substrate-binding protein [Desulfitobacteriaceae bacterium]|nr:amino acid ABC transporter substrate-binding protein [Desulfitobacteriaceae bacterium]MDI6915855.1 amino acid ABC transporter substrate-binding protein [Desulfitobacteriaceae bacterium]
MFKKLSIRRALALVSISGLLLSMAGCGSVGSSTGTSASKDSRDYFKVGVITSLSGSEVYGGNVTKYGYDLWADAVNKKGGIKVGDKSYQVKLVYADDQSDPTAGANAAERMITSEKVDFILGPYTSGVTMAVAPILDKYKVPMITGSAESPVIWKNKFKYTFGAIPAADLTANSPLETLAKQPNPPKSVAILGVNDAFSKAVAEAFKASAEKIGMKVVKFDVVPAGTDFTPLISAIKQLNPDVLAVGGHETEHMQVIKASKSLGFMPKAFVMHYGITTPDFIKNTGKDGDYVYGAAVWTPDLKLQDDLFGSVQDYVKASKEKFNAEPDYTQAACSATGEAFSAALAQIGAKPPLSDQQRERLAKALEQVDIKTFFGPIKFATDGNWYHDNVGLKALTIQMRNGNQLVVGPDNLKAKDPVYPVPAFNAR